MRGREGVRGRDVEREGERVRGTEGERWREVESHGDCGRQMRER